MKDEDEIREALLFGDRQGWSPHHSTVWFRALEALDRLQEAHAGREGMVTVFDSEGRYVGCMGVETWQTLLLLQKEESSST